MESASKQPFTIEFVQPDSGRGGEKVEGTFFNRPPYNSFHHQPLLPQATRTLEQKHQFEGPDFVHPAQCLKQRNFREQCHNGVDPLEDNNELGERGGCDSGECLQDGGIVGIS